MYTILSDQVEMDIDMDDECHSPQLRVRSRVTTQKLAGCVGNVISRNLFQELHISLVGRHIE